MLKINLFMVLLLAIPALAIAQKQFCIIKVHITGDYQPIRAELKLTLNAQENLKASFTNNIAILTCSLDHSLLADLWIFDNNDRRLGGRIAVPIYLTPGEININYEEAGASSKMTVEGPQMSRDYEMILHQPSIRYLTTIEELKVKLKQPGQDTASITVEVSTLTHAYYDGLRNYVKSHPDSPLSIAALEMMGMGDPTVTKPAKELEILFHSLSQEIQNSVEGQQYARYEENVWHL